MLIIVYKRKEFYRIHKNLWFLYHRFIKYDVFLIQFLNQPDKEDKDHEYAILKPFLYWKAYHQ